MLWLLTRWYCRLRVACQIDKFSEALYSGMITRELYERGRRLSYLCRVEGFAPVLTLLKHGHLSRARRRYDKFLTEWDENGVKLFDRK